MILDELTLHNFGVYRGRQKFHLTPVCEERPVILLGALNGNGKTTFLDALQLVFFGKLARCSGRDGVSYEEYLRRSVHRTVAGSEGASIEVKFRRQSGGAEHRYLIHRSWSAANGAVRERFSVMRDGREDAALTERWQEHLEDMLPNRIAPLFFFDGEKIEQFADIERAAEILSTAVHALLGLDIVERLQGDLQVFERRKRLATKSDSEREAIEQATNELATLEVKLKDLKDERAQLRTAYDRAVNTLDTARERFRAEGGELYEQREQLSQARGEAAGRVATAEVHLRQVAADVTPLLLVVDQLQAIVRQAEAEREADTAAAVLNIVEDRDRQTIARLQDHAASAELTQAVEAFLQRSREALRGESEHERYLRLSEEGRAQLGHLLAAGLPGAHEAATSAIAELDAAQQELDRADRNLSGVPTPEAIEGLARELSEAERAVAEKEQGLTANAEALEAVERDLNRQRAMVAASLDKEAQRKLQDEDTHRMLEHSGRVRETLGKFRERVVAHHLAKLEALIVECFNALVRKDPLVAAVKIDPETFALELKGGDWQSIPAERLSAGERQLLAVAMLWALARASGRPAPAVIDTPLSRLDSVHRSNLVERYFPQASHQVILLSTDKEIDPEAYDRLSPAISRSFLVEYDQTAGGSAVREGYFFEEQT